MIYEDVFMDGIKLPPPLPRSEIKELFEQVRLGNDGAKEKIIIHNIRLVLNAVQTKFYNTSFDKKELASVGLIGLIKSVDKFDVSRGIEFSTFAITVIDNEIRMYMRKEKRHLNVISIYEQDDNEITLEDKLYDENVHIEEDYIYNEELGECAQLLEILSDRERKIIMLHFGFYNGIRYTQNEIAEMVSLSQSYVSRIIISSLNKLRTYAEYKQVCYNILQKQYYTLNSEDSSKKTQVKIKR